jgi:hypothetical protein
MNMACNCLGGPGCCRNNTHERRIFGGLIERKEYWPDGRLKSWTWGPAAPDAAAPMVPSPSEVIQLHGGGSGG